MVSQFVCSVEMPAYIFEFAQTTRMAIIAIGQQWQRANGDCMLVCCIISPGMHGARQTILVVRWEMCWIVIGLNVWNGGGDFVLFFNQGRPLTTHTSHTAANCRPAPDAGQAICARRSVVSQFTFVWSFIFASCARPRLQWASFRKTLNQTRSVWKRLAAIHTAYRFSVVGKGRPWIYVAAAHKFALYCCWVGFIVSGSSGFACAYARQLRGNCESNWIAHNIGAHPQKQCLSLSLTQCTAAEVLLILNSNCVVRPQCVRTNWMWISIGNAIHHHRCLRSPVCVCVMCVV